MVNLNTTIKKVFSLSRVGSNNVSPSEIDSFTKQITVRKRIENQVRSIPAGGSITIDKAAEGITNVAFVSVRCFTAGKSMTVTFDAIGSVTVSPSSTTDYASFEGDFSFSTMAIANADVADIEVVFNVFEVAP